MFKLVNVCYVVILVVSTKDVENDFDVVLKSQCWFVCLSIMSSTIFSCNSSSISHNVGWSATSSIEVLCC